MYPKTIGDWIFGYPCDGLSWLLRQWVSLQHVLSCGCPGESVTERVYGMDQRGVSRCTLHRVSCESRFAQYRFNPFCFSVLPRELLQVVTLVKLRVGSLKCALFFRNLIRHLYSIHFRCHTETSSDLYWAYQTRYRIPSLLHPTSSIIPIRTDSGSSKTHQTPRRLWKSRIWPCSYYPPTHLVNASKSNTQSTHRS